MLPCQVFQEANEAEKHDLVMNGCLQKETRIRR